MGEVTNNKERVARHFKVAPRTIHRWLREGMPRLSGGYYDLDRIKAWLTGKKSYGPEFRLTKEEAEVLFLEGIQEAERGMLSIFRALELAQGERQVGVAILKKFLAILPRP